MKNKGVYPTCFLKHMNRVEWATDNYIEDIRASAMINVAQRISSQHRCTLERALNIIDQCEYSPLVDEEMMRLHKEGGKTNDD
jgi:hypothetical protein